MTDDSNTAIDDTQTDEDILSYTVSDEALEAAAGTRTGAGIIVTLDLFTRVGVCGCLSE
jgi:hypothetical protein